MRRCLLLVATLGILSTSAACDEPSSKGAAPSAPSATAVKAAPTRAVITMDDAHDLIKSGAPYVIAPADELVIELHGHRFAARDGGALTVDSVHVAHGNGEYHRASWAGGDSITLNAAALDPVKGGAFAGFVAGEPYLVAVGREEPNDEGVLRFAPAWSATVNVAPR